MASEAQINANRANGAQSHGGLTEETRQKSAQNSRKHGLCAKIFLVKEEDREAYEQMVETVFSHYKPGSEMERVVVQEMADHTWKLSQVPVYEASVTTKSRLEAKGQWSAIENDAEREAIAEGDVQNQSSRTLTNLSLQQTRTQRMLEKAIARFEAMRRDREVIAKFKADHAEASIMGNREPLPSVGVVFSKEYLVQRVAFRKYNPTIDILVFDRFWGDPKSKTPA